MGRDIRDEKQMDQVAPSGEGMTDQSLSQSSIQLSISEELQHSLVQTIKADYDAAKSARDSKDYGWNDKGEKLTFEKFFKDLKDLYNARRFPKTIPWRFCSNRSLRIAASILDTKTL